MRNTKIMCAVMLDTKVGCCKLIARALAMPYLVRCSRMQMSLSQHIILKSLYTSLCDGWPLVQGPEIRTGFLKDAKPIQLTTGKEITITTDYESKGDSDTVFKDDST
jgi:hypothetical protein